MRTIVRIFVFAVGALALAAGVPAQEDGATTATAPAAADFVTTSPWESAETPAALDGLSSGAVTFNFKGAPVEAVLDYMSRAAGFTVVRETSLSGTVDAWSHQPLTQDEAVELLQTVLAQKGAAVLREGRTLTIVDRDEAATRRIPVVYGADPAEIPVNETVVTQIMPVRYASARELIPNLTQLMPENAVLSANEGSNALVLTAEQSVINRIAQVVRSLDTSISQITRIRVFPLRYADASELAEVLNEIFRARTSATNSNVGGGDDRGRRMREFFMRQQGGGGDGGEAPTGDGRSEALAAQNLVLAVADTRTNSLVVTAPEEMMAMVSQLVDEIDQSAETVTEIRVFPLRYADAQTMAETIASVFGGTASSGSNASNNRSRWPQFMQMMQRGRGGGDNNQESGTRSALESTVVAEADERTNSVIVLASAATMTQIGEMIRSLDENPARAKKVFVYNLRNADAENVAEILESMFSEGNTTTNRQNVPQRGASNQQTLGGFGQSGAARR